MCTIRLGSAAMEHVVRALGKKQKKSSAVLILHRTTLPNRLALDLDFQLYRCMNLSEATGNEVYF